MKPKKISKTVKRFLSETPNEFATVSYTARVDPKDYYTLLDATVRITDCDNNVRIFFDAFKKEHLKKRIKKLDVLIDTLQEFRAILSSDEIKEAIQCKIDEKAKKRSVKSQI